MWLIVTNYTYLSLKLLIALKKKGRSMTKEEFLLTTVGSLSNNNNTNFDQIYILCILLSDKIMR